MFWLRRHHQGDKKKLRLKNEWRLHNNLRKQQRSDTVPRVCIYCGDEDCLILVTANWLVQSRRDTRTIFYVYVRCRNQTPGSVAVRMKSVDVEASLYALWRRRYRPARFIIRGTHSLFTYPLSSTSMSFLNFSMPISSLFQFSSTNHCRNKQDTVAPHQQPRSVRSSVFLFFFS